MEDTHLTIKIEPLTLSSVADGILEQDFQRALLKVAQAFEEPPDGVIPWELSNGRAKSTVTLKIEFIHNFETGNSHVACKTNVKLPEPKKVARPVLLKQGRFHCEPSGEQLSLLSVSNKEQS